MGEGACCLTLIPDAHLKGEMKDQSHPLTTTRVRWHIHPHTSHTEFLYKREMGEKVGEMA